MQKISPFFWFDTHAEEAAAFYTSLFGNSKIDKVSRYGDAGPGPKGAVFTVDFQLQGQSFIALNGGPVFGFTPAVSLFVTCRTEKEIDALWSGLSDGGKVLMPLQKHPFSERFGWVGDRYGVSWQLNLTGSPTKISPFLMFVGDQFGKAEEAIQHYVSIFKDAGVEQVARYGAGMPEPEGKVMHGRFRLEGQELMAMESAGKHEFTFTPALSLFVLCPTQEEVDDLWEKLSAGGKKSQCGWLQDKYGVTWQVVPVGLRELIQGGDGRRSKQAMEAMMKMNKLDIREVRAAYDR